MYFFWYRKIGSPVGRPVVVNPVKHCKNHKSYSVNEFSIILPDGGEIQILPGLPDGQAQKCLPFAEIATAITHNSKMLFQHIQGDGFDLWWRK